MPVKMSKCCSETNYLYKRALKGKGIIDRTLLTRTQHEDLLAQPRPNANVPPAPKRKVKQCLIPKICPPRIDQLATPTQKLIEGVLQDFNKTLEAERVVRLVNLAHSNREERPRYSSQKCRKKKKKKRRKTKKENCLKVWLKKRVKQSVTLITMWILRKREFMPNYRQLLVSMGIFKALRLKKKCRRCMCRYTKTYLMKICEQLAVFIDMDFTPYKKPAPLESLPVCSEVESVESKKHIVWQMGEPSEEEEEEEEGEEGKEEGEESAGAEESEVGAGEGEGIKDEGEEEEEGQIPGEAGEEGEGEGEGIIPGIEGEGEGELPDIPGEIEEDEVEGEAEGEVEGGAEGEVEGELEGEGVIPDDIEGGDESPPEVDGGAGTEQGEEDEESPIEETDGEEGVEETEEESDQPEGETPVEEGDEEGEGLLGDVEGPLGGEETPTDGEVDESEEGGESDGIPTEYPEGEEEFEGELGETDGEYVEDEEEGERELPIEEEEGVPSGEEVEGEEAEWEEIEGEVEGEGAEVKPPEGVEGVPEVIVLEHPPESVSYLTCQVYASWLDEFGSNITIYSKCLRRFREMLEARSLHSTDPISKILSNWGCYLRDSSEFERNMTNYLKGKPVTKCAKCGDYTLYTIPKDHDIPPELKVAVDSTMRWKQMLDEAEKLCQMYTAEPEDTVSLASHETVHIMDAGLASSDTSMYVFEDFVPNNSNNNNNNSRHSRTYRRW